MKQWFAGSLVMAAGIVISTVLSPLLPAAAGTREAEQEAAPRSVLLSVHDRPSHHGRYRARAIPDLDAIRAGAPHSWAVEIRNERGSIVTDAALTVESWMPETGRRAPEQPQVTTVLDGYRIEGLRFDRRGWWNVKLEITAVEGTDSVAFNLIR
jgi:hypothetical protein